MVNDDIRSVINEALTNNGFMFQTEFEDEDNNEIQVWRNRKGKDYSICINDDMYKVVVKDDDDKQGFIVDVEIGNSVIASEIYYYDDLEDEYRDYINDLSNNDEADIRQIQDWNNWVETKKKAIVERTYEDMCDIGDEDEIQI